MTGGGFPPVSPVRAGLLCRCPRCGEGPLYDGYLKIRAACARCGLDFAFLDSGDGPAVFVIFILGAVVVGLALAVETLIGPPLWVHAVLWSLVTLAGALAMLPPFKAVLVALQYRHLGTGPTPGAPGDAAPDDDPRDRTGPGRP